MALIKSENFKKKIIFIKKLKNSKVWISWKTTKTQKKNKKKCENSWKKKEEVSRRYEK